jgi:hypothetical protein
MVISEKGSLEASEEAGRRLTGAVTAEDARKLLNDRAKISAEKVDALTEAMVALAEASGCRVCLYAAENGWWGDSIPTGWTHCSECHASWSGSQVWGHCSACHHPFRGVTAFDAHHDSGACKGMRNNPSPQGSEATWEGRPYVVKHQEKGDLLYWGSAIEMDPSIFGGEE